MTKRKRQSDSVNWSDIELSRLREKKRQREDAEPYNNAQTRRTAREVGMAEAKRSILLDTPQVYLPRVTMSEGTSHVDICSRNIPPRGLIGDDESSTEFMTALQEAESDSPTRQADQGSMIPAQEVVLEAHQGKRRTKRKKMSKRIRQQERAVEAPRGNSGLQESDKGIVDGCKRQTLEGGILSRNARRKARKKWKRQQST